MPQIIDLRWSVVNSAASGTIAVIAAVAGLPIKVWQVGLNALTATTVTFEDSSTALSGPYALGATETMVLPYTGAPWFYCNPGDAFNIVNSAAVQISGTVYYTQGG